jgi:hypothetical protein
MKNIILVGMLLVSFVLCCIVGCQESQVTTIEGVVAGIDFIPDQYQKHTVIRFEDGRVCNYAGWFSELIVGKRYLFQIRNSQWVIYKLLDDKEPK